jgi:serine protease inhibitor
MHVLLALALVCSAAPGAQPPVVNVTELVQADNKLGLDIFSYLSVDRPQENVFISPLSIALALQMTAHGAANATWDAMAGAMHAGHLDRASILSGNAMLRDQLLKADPKVRLDIANSLWLRKGVKLQKRFSDDCAKFYGAGVTVLDFARPDAVTTINNWVAKNTGDRIKQVISTLTPDEILVLINAIYFKGKWTKEFDPKETGTRSFHFAIGTTGDRKMMTREGRYRYRENGEVQAVALPYGNGRLNMYVFLPREKDGLGGLVGGLRPEALEVLFDGFDERKGEVVLPRFKIEFENSLTKVLRLLGMGPAFSPEADFSGMVVPPNTAAISEVIHKTFIEVNEEGTEAAAVTAVTMVATAMPNREENFSFVCDHPFLVAIRDDTTGSVLFLGAIYDPKQ